MLRWVLTFAFASLAHSALASGDETICDRAAAAAAHGSDVPVEYLRALTRTETGRARKGKLSPWPWTVNMEGKGRWFETRSEALAYVQKHHRRGARSFDIGCFQINFRWHGEAFDSIEAMFDPLANARYAARFLTELRGGKGTWRRAVGRYHSKTPKFANKYTRRFDRILANLAPAPAIAPVIAPTIAPAPGITTGTRKQVVAAGNQSAPAQNALPRPQPIPPEDHRPVSRESEGLARLAFLAPPSGAALVPVEAAEPDADAPVGGVTLLVGQPSRSLLQPARPLFN